MAYRRNYDPYRDYYWDRGNYNPNYDYDTNWDYDQGDYTPYWDYNNPSRNYNPNWDYDYNRNYDQGYWRNRNFNRGSNRNINQRDRNPNYGYDYDYDYDTGWYDTSPSWTYYEYWYVPGPYEGYGPQGYQRSDERIKDDIHDRLTRHGQLDARKIHVDVNDGVVDLTGSVSSRKQKRLAEDLTDDVPGVVDVNNQLTVNKQGKGHKGSQQKQTQAGQIFTGMEVDGSQGKFAGTVKEIRDNDFLLDRSMDRDVFVPFSAIQKIQDQKIFLNLPEDQVDDQGWQEPAVANMGRLGR